MTRQQPTGHTAPADRPASDPGEVFTTTDRVQFYEVGPDRRMGLVAVANLLQQAAGDHAQTLQLTTDQLIGKGLSWVLTRQRIRLLRRPWSNEELTVRTWTSGIDRRTFFREFQVCGADGTPCIEATSAWLLIDLAARRAISPPDWVVDAVPAAGPRLLTFETRSVPILAPDAGRSITLRARRSDIDINGHVNNAYLLAWILEPLDHLGLDQAPADVDMVFLAECRHGASYTVRAAEHAPGRWLHAIATAADGRDRVRASTIWPVASPDQ